MYKEYASFPRGLTLRQGGFTSAYVNFVQPYSMQNKQKILAKLLKGTGVATIQRKITQKYTHKKNLFSGYKMVLMKVCKVFQS